MGVPLTGKMSWRCPVCNTDDYLTLTGVECVHVDGFLESAQFRKKYICRKCANQYTVDYWYDLGEPKRKEVGRYN